MSMCDLLAAEDVKDVVFHNIFDASDYLNGHFLKDDYYIAKLGYNMGMILHIEFMKGFVVDSLYVRMQPNNLSLLHRIFVEVIPTAVQTAVSKLGPTALAPYADVIFKLPYFLVYNKAITNTVIHVEYGAYRKNRWVWFAIGGRTVDSIFSQNVGKDIRHIRECIKRSAKYSGITLDPSYAENYTKTYISMINQEGKWKKVPKSHEKIMDVLMCDGNIHSNPEYEMGSTRIITLLGSVCHQKVVNKNAKCMLWQYDWFDAKLNEAKDQNEYCLRKSEYMLTFIRHGVEETHTYKSSHAHMIELPTHIEHFNFVHFDEVCLSYDGINITTSSDQVYVKDLHQVLVSGTCIYSFYLYHTLSEEKSPWMYAVIANSKVFLLHTNDPHARKAKEYMNLSDKLRA